MGERQDQDRHQGREAVLPQSDGPLVKVELPDHQVLFAVVMGRRQEADTSWWFDLQIHLPSQGSEHGRLLAVPAAVGFRAPAGACTPIEGQSYDGVPTERYGVPARWRIEEPVYFGPDVGPARIVHRGDCRAVRDISRPAGTDQARATLTRPDAAPCPVCRPDRPLGTAPPYTAALLESYDHLGQASTCSSAAVRSTVTTPRNSASRKMRAGTSCMVMRGSCSPMCRCRTSSPSRRLSPSAFT